MKFKINKEEFLKSLNIVSRIAAVKPNLPVIANVLIEAVDKQIKLAATNLELGTVVFNKTKVEKNGKTTIPARTLYEFINNLPDEEINCEFEDNQFLIESKNSTTHLATISASEFPVIPTTTNKEANVSVNGPLLREAIDQVVFAAAVDTGRPALTGVLFKVDKNIISMVAADGYRLSFKKLRTNSGSSLQAIIPAKTLVELGRIIDDLLASKVEINLSPNENQIFFQIGDVELVSRLIDAQFPDWEKIIPTTPSTTIVVDRNDLMRTIKTGSILARESGNIVRFKIVDGMLMVSASSKELGDNTSRLPAKVNGEPLEIAFNYRYLTDVLSVMKSANVQIELTENIKPGKFLPANKQSSNDFYHIIMPVRVQD